MTLHAMDGLLRRDGRLDPDVAAPVALVRALHAFAGVACLEAALGSAAAGAPMTLAVIPGVLLTGSAIALASDRAWIRVLAVVAGWSGIAATLAAAIASTHLHPLVAGLIVALLWQGNAILGGAPALDWRRLAAAPPAHPERDAYDGAIEEL
jgi:hypothetical protein